MEIFWLAVADGYVPSSEHAIIVGNVFQVDNQLGAVFAQKIMQGCDVSVLVSANWQQHPMATNGHKLRVAGNGIEVGHHPKDHVIWRVVVELPLPGFGAFVFFNNAIPASAFDPLKGFRSELIDAHNVKERVTGKLNHAP